MTIIFLDPYLVRDISEYTDLRELYNTCSSLLKLKKILITN
jgi:hypothetical protein